MTLCFWKGHFLYDAQSETSLPLRSVTLLAFGRLFVKRFQCVGKKIKDLFFTATQGISITRSENANEVQPRCGRGSQAVYHMEKCLGSRGIDDGEGWQWDRKHLLTVTWIHVTMFMKKEGIIGKRLSLQIVAKIADMFGTRAAIFAYYSYYFRAYTLDSVTIYCYHKFAGTKTTLYTRATESTFKRRFTVVGHGATTRWFFIFG